MSPSANLPGLSIGERARRLDATRELLEQEGFEALLAYATPIVPGGVTYLTGYTPIFQDAWCVVTSQACALVTGADEYVHTGGECWLDPDDAYRVHRNDDRIQRVVQLLGSKVKRVAVAGDGFMPAPLWRALQDADGSLTFESTDLLSRLRGRKTQQEIDVIRVACSIADQASNAFATAVAPGVTETDLAGLIEASMRRAGLCQLAFPTVLGSGPRSLDLTMLPTLRAIEMGDMVLLDCGARSSGYCSDIARSTVAGDPSARQRDLLDTVRLMYTESRSLLKPGMDVRKVQQGASEVAKSAGYEFIHELGHGVGCDVHEYPPIDALPTEVLLEAGMVVAIEPGLYVEGTGGARMENTILITADGPEELTDRARLALG
jgi:Xaa-Pro aminopeptidase